MWLFTRIGFFSVVQDAHNANKVQVRTRVRADAQAFIRDCFTAYERKKVKPKVIHTPEADYPFRVVVDKETFGVWMNVIGEDIDYPNFKASVPPDRARIYHDVWNVMARAFMHDREE